MTDMWTYHSRSTGDTEVSGTQTKLLAPCRFEAQLLLLRVKDTSSVGHVLEILQKLAVKNIRKQASECASLKKF